MISKLPAGWSSASLGVLIELKYGKALPQSDRTGGGYPVFGSNGVVGAHAQALSRGPTLVVGRKGSVGEVNFSAIACSPIDTTYFVDDVPGGQFRFWFRSLQSLGLGSLNKSTAIPGLSRSDVYPIVVPVPPLAEQQRIADKLDTVLARVDACRDRLARVATVLKRFRQSVLAAATSGRLTEDWRQTIGSSDYIATTVSAVCQADRVITYGVIKLGDETPGGVPCLRTSNVRWLRLDLEGVKRISRGLSAEYTRTVLRGGEVLVNVRGTLGGVAVTTQEMAGWNVSREVAVVPVDQTKICSRFAALWIASEETQRWLAKVERGVAYVGINIEDLRELPIRLPPLAEQTEIVRRVETLFAFADRVEARLVEAQTAVDRLTPSLLAKAFRGELVPQDPADEPAAELLKRLAAQREAAPARPRRKRAMA